MNPEVHIYRCKLTSYHRVLNEQRGHCLSCIYAIRVENNSIKSSLKATADFTKVIQAYLEGYGGTLRFKKTPDE